MKVLLTYRTLTGYTKNVIDALVNSLKKSSASEQHSSLNIIAA